jgi:hypothetical protein
MGGLSVGEGEGVGVGVPVWLGTGVMVGLGSCAKTLPTATSAPAPIRANRLRLGLFMVGFLFDVEVADPDRRFSQAWRKPDPHDGFGLAWENGWRRTGGCRPPTIS